jgi:hypothetical protein
VIGSGQDLLNQQPCRDEWQKTLRQEPDFRKRERPLCAHSAPE